VTTALGEWAGEHDPLVTAPPPYAAAEPESLVVPMDTGVRIHFLDWGGGTAPGSPPASPILLVHELSQTAWSWAPVARRLAGNAHVVAVDLRGHGLSEAPRTGYDLESLAADVLTVATAMGWGSAAGGPGMVIGGHGPLGGAVAATAAAVDPGSVVGLALIDGGWESIPDVTGMSAPEYLAAIAEPPEMLASMDGFLRDRRGFDPQSWDGDQERAARAQVDQKHAGHVAMVARQSVVKAAVEGLFRFVPDEVLSHVDCPLLLVAASSGSADDEDARDRQLALRDVVRQRAEKTLPTRAVTLTGGHNLMRYRADALAAELLALAYQRP
jgi:pimeloyl-ACP methyl ester carboxylesterase